MSKKPEMILPSIKIYNITSAKSKHKKGAYSSLDDQHQNACQTTTTKDMNPRTLNEFDRLRREVAAEDGQVWVVVVLEDGKDGVADAAAQLQDRPRRRIRQFRKFGEEPVPVFEKSVLK